MRFRAVGLLSHTATTSEPSNWSRFLTTFGPQYPYPTTPNLTTASPLPFSIDSFATASDTWLAGCRTVDMMQRGRFLSTRRRRTQLQLECAEEFSGPSKATMSWHTANPG